MGFVPTASSIASKGAATRLNAEVKPSDVAQQRNRILLLSTWAFTVLFAVWVMFGVLSIPIRKEFNLNEVQVGWLVSIAVLSGSLPRLAAGIWTDRYGGRRVMTLLLIATALPCALVGYATSFTQLCILALLFGIAGNGFSVGIAWCSVWFSREHQGTALGVFGAGNVGASVTKLVGPLLIGAVAEPLFGGLVPPGWRSIPVFYSALLLSTAAALWYLTPSVDRTPGRGRSLSSMLSPLANVRVWRFSLYYVVVFGAYVALSVWLPKYYVDVFGVTLKHAAGLTAMFIFPASLLRPLGGWLSDRIGARKVMYWVFGSMALSCSILAIPNGHASLGLLSVLGVPLAASHGLGIVPFTVLVLVVGAAMGVGKAAVYKYVPQYYPNDVGAVGGIVGLLGALGGFFLPLLFAYGKILTGSPQTVFLVLLLVVLVSFAWLHVTVMRLVRLEAASPTNPTGLEPASFSP